MGLCFVGKIRLNDFLAQKVKPKPGKIVDTNGKVLGKHNGLHTFTIGQRHGIKIASSKGAWLWRS
jgi:tRNA-specific 2-thiouridylase